MKATIFFMQFALFLSIRLGQENNNFVKKIKKKYS